MPTFSLQEFLLRIVAVAIIGALHGFFTALTADRAGDRDPAFAGRLTLNPFPHFDLVGGLLMVLFTYGWRRPIDVSPTELRHPRRAFVWLALIPSLAVVACLLLFSALRPIAFTLLPSDAALAISSLVAETSHVGLAFVLFNLVPIPPLAGRFFVFAAAPLRTRSVTRVQSYATAGLAFFIGLGGAAFLLDPVVAWLADLIPIA